MAISAQDVINAIVSPVADEMKAQGIDMKARVKQLAREFKARTVEVVKFDGVIKEDPPDPAAKKGKKGKKVKKNSLPRGWRLIGKGDGKTLFEVTRIDMGIRQRARMDAHKLAGDYPADQHVVTVPQIRQVLDALNGRSLGLPKDRKKNVHRA